VRAADGDKEQRIGLAVEDGEDARVDIHDAPSSALRRALRRNSLARA
jgi:hypothetical protein